MTSIGSVAASGDARLQFGDRHHTTHNHYSANRDQCLADLRVTDPRDDKARIEGTKGDLLEDSYSWIRENAEFQQWENDEDSPLLWIKGDPGKGKTMLFCGIINELKKDTKNRVSFFLCQQTDLRLNSATAVLRGITYLLINEQPSLRSHLQQKYDHAGQSLFEDDDAWWSLCEIVTDMLKDRNLEKTFLLIDGLDECSVDLPLLLKFITKSYNTSSVKWIVTSRNWPSIEEHMEIAEQKATLCLELNDSSISASVKSYVHHRVNRLVRMKSLDNDVQQSVQNYLESHSNGTFL
ncbi:Vegetative incompatibility protein HET-E-1 [Cladobotryum mycophilum]|uniref:Vegetative incompatibility protein HET-E-1 n=1 Tax=Cladobotryum mycophilum TaxID=491253 RepID=A0ABR0T1M9_9HYPO